MDERRTSASAFCELADQEVVELPDSNSAERSKRDQQGTGPACARKFGNRHAFRIEFDCVCISHLQTGFEG